MMYLVLLLQLFPVVVITHSQQYKGSNVYGEATITDADRDSFENGSYLSAIPEDLKSGNPKRIPLDTDDHGDYVGSDDSHAHRTKRNGFGGVWPGGKVYYVISDAYWRWQIGMIWRAMKEIEDNSCIVFTLRKNESNYIFIAPIRGCQSIVGYAQNGEQMVSLTYWCFYHGSILHELMHALGFRHEQQRMDRDDYIDIQWYNIKRGLESEFNKVNGTTYNISYDLSSVMQYDSWTGCMCDWAWSTSMTQKDGSRIYRADRLSEKDVQRINARYQCGQSTLAPTTP